MARNYCTECGQQLEEGSNFCPTCGEKIRDISSQSINSGGSSVSDLGTELESAEESRTISFSVKESDVISETQYFNVDNIAFLKDVNAGPPFGVQLVIAGSIFLLFISPVFSSGSILMRMFFGFMFGAGLAFSLEQNYVKIGTVNDTHEISESSFVGSDVDIESDDVPTIEDQFLDVVPETINIHDKDNWVLYNIKYNYHFVPDNIVSMREDSEFNWFGKLIGILTVLLAIYIFIKLDLVYLLLLVPIGIVVWFLISLLGIKKGIKISTQGGEEVIFEMSTGNARKVIQKFQSRGQGGVWADAEKVS
ncbi:MAG: zinc ribbon domain-containing protein [Halobacteriaceae archaeon]